MPPKVDVEIVRVPLPPRTCRNCGEDFVPRSSINVFCCWDCNTQWHAERSPKRRTYFRILERDGFRCIYCGRSSIADGVKLALDHIHPHSRGGEDIASNLVTACFDCNSRKGARKVRKGVVQQVIWIVEQRNEQHGIQPNSPVEAFEHRPRSDRRD